jgi:hypothetical protein
MYALRYVGCPVFLDYAEYDPKWGYDIVKAANALHPNQGLPFTHNSFWNCFDQGFWASVPPSDEFQMLLSASRMLVGAENVCILTRPVDSPGCMDGKKQWIRRHLPEEMWSNYLIGEPKYLCAYPGALMVDDVEENVDKFRAHGGRAVLFPRPWNRLRLTESGGYVLGNLLNISKQEPQRQRAA